MAIVNGRITGMGTVIAANGQGDLQLMFGSSQKSKMWYFDPANTHLNTMNIYKPFRYNGAFALDASGAAARLAANRSTRFGFHNIPNVAPLSFISSPGNWVYYAPGISGDSNPQRAHDFEGYDKHCVCPFLLRVPTYTGGYLRRGEPFLVRVITDSYTEQVYESEGSDREWESGHNLSLSDLLQNELSNMYYLTLFVADTASPSSRTNIIIINEKMPALAGLDYTYALYPQGDGSLHPAIPVLRDATLGNTFTMCACFGTLPDNVSFQSQNNDEYVCLTDRNTWGGDRMSLAIEAGQERQSFRVDQPATDISGSIISLVLVDTGVVENYMHKYRIDSISALVSSGAWGSSQTITFNVTLTSTRNNCHIGTSYNPMWQNTATFTVYKSVPANTQNYQVELKDTSYYVWLMDDTYDVITADATAARSGQNPTSLMGTDTMIDAE